MTTEKDPYTYETWTLSRILTTVDCGSGDWGWREEFDKLDHARPLYLDTLELNIRLKGIRHPVEIGSDGRLWDGHHRLLIAHRLGITRVPVKVHKDFRRASRFFLSRGWDSPWWKPVVLVGIGGGTEECNRTIGFRLPGERVLFLCLNIPLRQEPCSDCMTECGEAMWR